jgi:predicted nucleotidyltransferase
MSFLQSIARVVMRLQEAGVDYAVIGGMAMALRGVQRTTFDLDFLLLLSQLPTAHDVLVGEGYAQVYHSENVSHYENPSVPLGRIDILHAFRDHSLAMLQRAEVIEFGDAGGLPVVQLEDLIGLKIQAAKNSARRALGDWNDIYRMVIHAAEIRHDLNWGLVARYLALFDQLAKLSELQRLYEDHR